MSKKGDGLIPLGGLIPPDGLIPLSVPEIRHLFVTVLTASPAELPRILDWSIWHRRHQAVARYCPYKARAP